MKLETKPGKHTERDRIILVNGEAITLKDFHKILKEFTLNELRRIRIDLVRADIIRGLRPFMFVEEMKKTIEEAKDQELQSMLKGGKSNNGR